jgi:hypothetical protein
VEGKRNLSPKLKYFTKKRREMKAQPNYKVSSRYRGILFGTGSSLLKWIRTILLFGLDFMAFNGVYIIYVGTSFKITTNPTGHTPNIHFGQGGDRLIWGWPNHP